MEGDQADVEGNWLKTLALGAGPVFALKSSRFS